MPGQQIEFRGDLYDGSNQSIRNCLHCLREIRFAAPCLKAQVERRLLPGRQIEFRGDLYNGSNQSIRNCLHCLRQIRFAAPCLKAQVERRLLPGRQIEFCGDLYNGSNQSIRNCFHCLQENGLPEGRFSSLHYYLPSLLGGNTICGSVFDKTTDSMLIANY